MTAQDGALEIGPIRDCNETLTNYLIYIGCLLRLKELAHDLISHFGMIESLSGQMMMHPSSAAIRDFSNTINFLLDSYKFMQETLNLSRHTLSGFLYLLTLLT